MGKAAYNYGLLRNEWITAAFLATSLAVMYAVIVTSVVDMLSNPIDSLTIADQVFLCISNSTDYRLEYNCSMSIECSDDVVQRWSYLCNNPDSPITYGYNITRTYKDIVVNYESHLEEAFNKSINYIYRRALYRYQDCLDTQRYDVTCCGDGHVECLSKAMDLACGANLAYESMCQTTHHYISGGRRYIVLDGDPKVNVTFLQYWPSRSGKSSIYFPFNGDTGADAVHYSLGSFYGNTSAILASYYGFDMPYAFVDCIYKTVRTRDGPTTLSSYDLAQLCGRMHSPVSKMVMRMSPRYQYSYVDTVRIVVPNTNTYIVDYSLFEHLNFLAQLILACVQVDHKFRVLNAREYVILVLHVVLITISDGLFVANMVLNSLSTPVLVTNILLQLMFNLESALFFTLYKERKTSLSEHYVLAYEVAYGIVAICVFVLNFFVHSYLFVVTYLILMIAEKSADFYAIRDIVSDTNSYMRFASNMVIFPYNALIVGSTWIVIAFTVEERYTYFSSSAVKYTLLTAHVVNMIPFIALAFSAYRRKSP